VRCLGLAGALTLAVGCATGPVVPSDPEQAADSHAGAGLHLIAEGQPEAARPRLERALELVSAHPQALTGMGLVAEAAGDGEASLTYQERAVEAAPDSGPVLNNYGRALCRSGKIDAALEIFEQATAAEGYQSPEVALTNAARCALRDGRPSIARERVAEALEIAPGFEPARSLRAQLENEEDER